jgi:hypothetical protein
MAREKLSATTIDTQIKVYEEPNHFDKKKIAKPKKEKRKRILVGSSD